MDKFYENGLWTPSAVIVLTRIIIVGEPAFPTVRAQNKGWRIDYISITKPLHAKLKSAAIYPDAKHSDHCPVFLELA